jgi:uncharacterized protein
MLIGVMTNSAVILLGGASGALLGRRVPERLRQTLPLTFGLCSIGLGVMLIAKVHYMPAVILALVLGALIGELCYFERGIALMAGRCRGLAERIFPPVPGLSQDEFLDKFVAILVLFCASGTGIFGAIQEGMSGDPSILYIKSILDLFTAAIFATSLGFMVTTIALPQFLVQLVLALLAAQILPLTTPAMMGDFSCAGGLIMVATGLRIAGIKAIPVANMLPALLLVMPFSALWLHFVL